MDTYLPNIWYPWSYTTDAPHYAINNHTCHWSFIQFFYHDLQMDDHTKVSFSRKNVRTFERPWMPLTLSLYSINHINLLSLAASEATSSSKNKEKASKSPPTNQQHIFHKNREISIFMMKHYHSKVNNENHHQLTKNMHKIFALEFVDYEHHHENERGKIKENQHDHPTHCIWQQCLQDVLPEHLQSPCVTEEKTKENVQLEWIWWPTNYLSTTLFSSQIYPKDYMHCIALHCVVCW